MATKNKSDNKNFEKIKKSKKETILIEILPSTIIEHVDDKMFINGFEHIEPVCKFGKAYAKCYNRKQ